MTGYIDIMTCAPQTGHIEHFGPTLALYGQIYYKIVPLNSLTISQVLFCCKICPNRGVNANYTRFSGFVHPHYPGQHVHRKLVTLKH